MGENDPVCVNRFTHTLLDGRKKARPHVDGLFWGNHVLFYIGSVVVAEVFER